VTSKQKPLVLTIPQAAQRLGISKESAYKAAKKGTLPSLRIGGSVRVPTVVVEQMIANALAKVSA
jgi:excisionase family DNA binding protein